MHRLLIVMLAACIEPSVRVCGDSICPLDRVCIDDQRCVDPTDISSCDGIAVATACTANGVPVGRCTDHGGTEVCDPARCGDGYIDDVLHEDCDGAAATSAVQCVDLGYDLGRPRCDQCRFDLAGCTRFGWLQIVDAAVFAMYTNGPILAYLSHAPDRLEVHGGGYDLVVPGTFTAIYGGGGRVVTTDAGQLYDVLPTGLAPITTPFFSDLTSLVVADDKVMLAMTAAGCTLWQYDDGSGWNPRTNYPSAGCSGNRLAVSPTPTGKRVFMRAGGTVQQLDVSCFGGPVCWSQAFDTGGEISDMVVASSAGGEAVFTAGNGGLHRYTTTDSVHTKLLASPVSTLAVTASFVYASDANGVVSRWDGGSFDVLRGAAPRLATDGTHVFAYTGPIYKFTGLDFGERAGGDERDGPIRCRRRGPGAEPVVATNQLLMTPDPTGNGWQPITSPGTPMHAVAGLSRTWLATSTYAAGGVPAPHVYEQLSSGAAFTDVEPAGGPSIDGLWMASSGALFAAGRIGTAGYLGIRTSAWASITPAGCEFHAVWGIDAGDAVAAGACGGVGSIWSYDGTSWTELQRTALAAPFYSVRAYATGEVYAVGDAGATWFDRTSWQTDATVIGHSISGAPSDLWVSGVLSPIQHYDGAMWSQMTTHTLGTTVIAASRARVLMPGGGLGHVVLVRDPAP